jgi:hypothetical protein
VLVERASLELERHGSTPFIDQRFPLSPRVDGSFPEPPQYNSNSALRRKKSADLSCHLRLTRTPFGLER